VETAPRELTALDAEPPQRGRTRQPKLFSDDSRTA